MEIIKVKIVKIIHEAVKNDVSYKTRIVCGFVFEIASPLSLSLMDVQAELLFRSAPNANNTLVSGKRLRNARKEISRRHYWKITWIEIFLFSGIFLFHSFRAHTSMKLRRMTFVCNVINHVHNTIFSCYCSQWKSKLIFSTYIICHMSYRL